MIKQNSKKPFVSIIIVNWNGMSFLKDCLDSVSLLQYAEFETIFVDNASSDGSVEFVRKNYPFIKVFVNKENLGVGGGYEVALAKAAGQAVLLLNTDTIFTKDLLTSLVNVLYEDKKIGAVQPKLVLYPNRKLIDSIGCFFLPTGNLYHFGREKDHRLPLYNKRMEIFSTKGACMLVKKEVLDKTGLFDEKFFAYFEDTDFCMRIWMAGYTIVYDPKEIVFHRGGATSKKINQSRILFHAYKNNIYAYIKNFSFEYVIKIVPIMLGMYQLAFFGYIITGKFNYALALQRGILWNIINILSVLRKRRYIQENIREVSDKEFMPRLTKQVSPLYYWYQFFGGMERYKDSL